MMIMMIIIMMVTLNEAGKCSIFNGSDLQL